MHKPWSLIGILLIACTAWLPLTGCNTLTEEQEIAIGIEQAPDFLAKNGGEIPSPQIRQYVSRIGMRLAAASDRPNLPWEFFVLDSSVINAFALPGGKVFISRGLMAQLTNEAELAGVLGHEVGHVVGKHIGQQIGRQQALDIGVQILGASVKNEWVTVLGGNAAGLYLLKFSRDQESEADSLGMAQMTRIGYDPRGMVGVLQVLDKAAGGGSQIDLFSTHPNPKARIAAANTALGSQPPPSGAVVGEAEYRANVLEPLNKLPPPKHQPM